MKLKPSERPQTDREPEGKPAAKPRKWRLYVGILLAVFICLEAIQLRSERTVFTSAVAHVLFKDNFHVVKENRLYRSAEMSDSRMRERIQQYGIRTVIDLRMGGIKNDVVPEDQVIRDMGATYVHFPVRGSRKMSRRQVARLVKLFDRSEGPILVHCSSGTHRSGVASAIWLLSHGASIKEAEAQLSPSYGFFKFERDLKGLLQGYPTVDETLWHYIEKNKKKKISLRRWVAGHR